MFKPQIRISIWLCLCFPFYLNGQTPQQRAVELSALVQEFPPQINLSWRLDSEAEQYTVYRKALEAIDWGEPIAVLPGTATTFSDSDVQVGIGYEYAFYKKEFGPARDTFCVTPGSNLSFTINSQFGESLCCNFGFGYYELSSCGMVNISGGDYGFSETQTFEVCQSTESCVELIVEVQSNIFPHLNSWTLTDTQTGALIGSSGPQGTLISERPSFGYIYSGIKIPPREQQGLILLLIDDLFQESLADEINRLEMDLIQDGWQVVRQYVSRNLAVPEVKEVIKGVRSQLPELSALFIIGHVAVPYAGDIYPDSHTEHRGAWAADMYYAELDGEWTDETVNRATAFFAYNHNVPGDGKFDQSYPMDEVDLQMGRVDFYNLPTFNLSETELLKRYFNKNHDFRNRNFTARRMALIDDNFGHVFAAPAACSWRNFAPMFGYENVFDLDYFSTMRNESFLFSYGCGSGTHISSEGIGSTANFASDSLKTVFTLLFGSQFGDWDNVDNFLRAPLASGWTLTNAWSGSNPPWTLHHMAMGYPIGYSTLKTQNSNNGVYIPGPQLVHVALMGDPTLRLHPAKPVTDLTIINGEEGAILNWMPPEDEMVEGYHIYRTDTISGQFVRINADFVKDTHFVDQQPLYGKNVYMVRGIKLEESGSGTYYNLTPGAIDSTEIFIVSDVETPVILDWEISPNPATEKIYLKLNNSGSDKIFLEIFNNLGQNVLSMHINTTISSIYEEIDLSFLESGIFFVAISGSNFQETKKIILR
jgi:hypothetical protein